MPPYVLIKRTELKNRLTGNHVEYLSTRCQLRRTSVERATPSTCILTTKYKYLFENIFWL